jgi:hypothetical protein
MIFRSWGCSKGNQSQKDLTDQMFYGFLELMEKIEQFVVTIPTHRDSFVVGGCSFSD